MSNFTYYNATTICKKDNLQANDEPAVFEDTTSQPIIITTEKYKFSIARYSMLGHHLPIWIPNISSGNTTTYGLKMNIQFNNKSFTSDIVYLQYINRNNLSSSDPEYYYVYSYELFIEMMNNAFSSCLANLQSQIIGYTIQSKPPFMVYNSQSNLFTMYFDKNGNGGNNPEDITITFNNELYGLLNSYYYQRQNDNFWDLIVVDKITNKYTDTDTNVNYIIVEQSFSTTAIMSPVESIIFSSDSIQLKPEIIGSVSVVGQVNNNLSSNQGFNTQNQITDIVLDLEKSSDYNAMITYSPSLYRYITMLPSKDLQHIKFAVWWLNKNTQVRQPVKLANGGLITLKLLFEKIE
jgi:hypothetical protein